MLASESQMGKYCPSFIASTGEKVECTKGGHVINGNYFSAPTFSEISLTKPSFSYNPLKCATMLLRKFSAPRRERRMNEKYGIKVTNSTGSQSVSNYGLNFGKANIGQIDDINILAQTYENHKAKYPNTDKVLYGVSRGAATTFNFLALHKPEGVKAAVIEGVFDDIPHVIKHVGYRNNKSALFEYCLHGLLQFCARKYNPHGPFPSTCYKTIDKEIPLLLVTSLKDEQVPHQSTMRLYSQLKNIGHDKVHLFVLQDAKHPMYMIGKTQDRDDYQAIVHSFYRQYGLAYNEELANEGQKLFESTVPSIAELEHYLKASCCKQ